MKRSLAVLYVPMMLVAGCSKNGTTHTSPKPNDQHISVVTQHNDNQRSGLNNQESSLTVSNVNSKQFGKLFTLTIDDQVYAQPLLMGNLSIGTGNHNVLFVASVNNSVYAFDGDNGDLLWKKNYTNSGMRPPNSGDMSSNWCSTYMDIYHNIGIIGTPAIDSVAKTIYFVTRSTDGTHFFQNLHAVDITSGNEQSGSPVVISASVAGSGDGSVANVISFDPMRSNQRQGLTLVNGVIYITYASHCDWNPYHGWILGYDAQSLQQKIVYNDTPSGEAGGIWESGQGMAADLQGNLYVTTGNGTVGQGNLYTPTSNGTDEINPNPNPSDLTNRSESAVKLTPSGSTLLVSSFFTPTNYLNLNANDLDYGVMGTLLIPNSNYYFTGCKDGNLYLLDKDNMGGYSPSSNQVQQTIPINAGLHSQPAYYKGSSNEYVYVWSENDQMRALSFNRSSNTFATNQMISSENGPIGGCGADLVVSSNGSLDGTGIVWANYATSGDAAHANMQGVLRAFDANNISKEIWNSLENASDDPGNYAKFSSPTVANGHVYLPTFSNQVVVYGLK
jgi:PQQ enzyme repeat